MGYGVPDTVAGRLDMIVLHLVLLVRQLAKDQGKVPVRSRRLGQQLFDRFCRDIDDNFREMGVGDLAVPKEMQRVAEAFYGRAKVYETALADDDGGCRLRRRSTPQRLRRRRRRRWAPGAWLPICARRAGGSTRKSLVRWRARSLNFPTRRRLRHEA